MRNRGLENWNKERCTSKIVTIHDTKQYIVEASTKAKGQEISSRLEKIVEKIGNLEYKIEEKLQVHL